MRKVQGDARCADGARISFHIQGKEGSPRLALVHSLAMDHRFWLPVAERISDAAEILIYDCRGHGASDKPAGPYTTDLFARDLADLMDHIGWPSATVGGASMGGCISLAFCAAFPQRTDALALIDTTAWYGPDAPTAWASRAEKALSDGLAGLVDFQKTRWFGDSFRQEHAAVVQQCIDIFLANDPRAYAETCRMLGAHNTTAALSSISCPAIVVVGEDDYATPVEMARTMHEAIRGSRLTVIGKARHLTPLEKPDLIAAEIGSLLEAAGKS